MTEDEVKFCNLVNAFVKSQGYSTLDLTPATGGKHYTLRLHRLGDPEHLNKYLTVFSEDLAESVRIDQLPEGLRKNLEHECEMRSDRND